MKNPKTMNNNETSKTIKNVSVWDLVPHFTNGNIKVGNMLTWNKLAGAGYLLGVLGSCGEFCKGGCYDCKNPMKSPCYVFKSYAQYGASVIDSHTINTLWMRYKMAQTFTILNKQLKKMKKSKPIRIHASGEFESAEEVKGWFRLAELNPSFPFYVYTKAYKYVDEAMEDWMKLHGKNIPDNFYINVSIWHESGVEFYHKWEHVDNIKAFVYNDGYDYAGKLEMKCNCPAYKKETKVDKKGNVKERVVLKHDLTCDRCKLCFINNKGAKVISCLDH